jgi:hypothetical protein
MCTKIVIEAWANTELASLVKQLPPRNLDDPTPTGLRFSMAQRQADWDSRNEGNGVRA